jgi:NAD(P)H-hydrate epimerase
MPAGFLSREQVRSVDARAMDEYGLPGIVLMENAARAVVEVVMAELSRAAPDAFGRVLVVSGAGNNGGDGFAAARHLHNRGADVRIALCSPRENVAGDALVSLVAAERMGLPVDRPADGPVFDAESLRRRLHGCDLVVDALLGTGLSGPVREPHATVITMLNECGKSVVAVDLPSGLDCDTGVPLGVAVRATVTVTFVAPKLGFSNPQAAEFTGRVVVGDIGAPRELIQEVARGR